MKSKKGFLGDAIFLVAFLFLMSVVVVLGWFTLSKINDSWQNSTELPAESKTIMSNWSGRYVSVFDWFMAIVFIGMVIAMILSAYLLRNTPVLAGIAILVLFITIGIAMRVSNAYRGFISAEGIAEYAASFNITNTIMDNLPKFLLFILVIFVIVLYAKGRGQMSV